MMAQHGEHMIRPTSIVAALALFATIGCAVAPPESAAETVSHETFAGSWQSVTPSMEFIGLSVVSKSSEMGALGMRLTLSGLYWEGNGRIDGDSLVANMLVLGRGPGEATLVARVGQGGKLQVKMHGGTPAPLTLTMVRER